MKSASHQETLSTALQTQWDSLQGFAGIGLKMVERITNHNLDALHTLLDEHAKASRDANPVDTMAALPGLQTAQLERGRSYWHTLFDILAEVQEETVAEARHRMGSSNQAVTALMEKMYSSLPAGSLGVDTFRSVLATAGRTMDNLGRAAQHMVESSEDKLETAPDATAKAGSRADHGEDAREEHRRRAA